MRAAMKQIAVLATFAAFVLLGVASVSPTGAVPAPSVSQSLIVPYPYSIAYPFRDGYPYTSGPLHVPIEHAVLTVPDTQFRQALLTQHSIPTFPVDIRLYNDQGDLFYNVFWNRLIPLPGHLALYDADKRYIMDLTQFSGGSRVMVDWNNASDLWIRIPIGDYVGATVEVSLPYPTYRRIPPGTYYLQVIYTQNAVLQPGDLKKPSGLTDNDPVTFRSNAVKIMVVNSK
jgi:hypothetical protein